ncbi:MAG TPA: hypothetical protein PKE47_02235, partial [Verrucomicrobiota bacterium]|nr:hypothetical protein [Verrucomicrobiota bacterium]
MSPRRVQIPVLLLALAAGCGGKPPEVRAPDGTVVKIVRYEAAAGIQHEHQSGSYLRRQLLRVLPVRLRAMLDEGSG